MIQINEKYYIKADNNNYTLVEKLIIQEKKSKNYGKEIFKDIGYYTSLEAVINGLMTTITRKYISKEEINSITELQNQLKVLKDMIANLNLKF